MFEIRDFYSQQSYECNPKVHSLTVSQTLESFLHSQHFVHDRSLGFDLTRLQRKRVSV